MLPQTKADSNAATPQDEHYHRAMFIVSTLVHEQCMPLRSANFNYDMENIEYATKLVAKLLSRYDTAEPGNHAGLPFEE